MKKLYFLLSFLLLPASYLFAQQLKPVMQSTSSKSMNLSAECIGYINPPTADPYWRAIVSPVPVMHNTERDEVVERLKAERLLQKLAVMNVKSEGTENSGLNAVPSIGASFVGNHANGSSPLDNCVAVSNGGVVVSVTNTTILCTNSQGTFVFYKDLLSFINDTEIQGVCDPVILYDAGVDRFVFFCQVSPLNSVKSKILLFFSKSANPAVDGWYYYKLSGNPLSNGCAFDYPKLAYSDNELYITGNLFRDSDGKFSQAVLFQITKAPAFNGQNMNYTIWYGIDGNPFTICPLSLGQQGSYGPGCYLVATSSSDNNKFELYRLTDDRTSGTAQLTHSPISTNAWQVAPNAPQPGTTVLLNTNDSRTLGGFYLNNVIHFVFNSVFANNYCGVNYNRLDLSTMYNTSVVFGQDGSDYCYPSVASSGVNSSDQAVLIGFQKVSNTSFPSIRVVECDNSMNWSASVEVKPGEGYVSYTGGNTERWGDYSGIYRKYNASKPTCWMSGAYGATTNEWDTWIAEVFDNSNGIAEGQVSGPAVNIYPNPAVDMFSLEFFLNEASDLSIDILDAGGKLVKNLYNGKGYQGKNILTFNKANLKPGMYFINLKSANKILKNEKLIIG